MDAGEIIFVAITNADEEAEDAYRSEDADERLRMRSLDIKNFSSSLIIFRKEITIKNLFVSHLNTKSKKHNYVYKIFITISVCHKTFITSPHPLKKEKNTLKHMDFVLSTLITAIIYFNKNVAISFARYKFFMKRKTQLKFS